MNNPISDQIVGTLQNMRRVVVAQGITVEADALWQHALWLYRMRRSHESTCIWPDCGLDTNCVTGEVCGPQCRDATLPAFLRKQAE